MVAVCHRAKGMVAGKVVLDCADLLAEGDEHSHSALTVADIVNFFVSDAADVGEGCREVKGGHVVEGKVPEFAGSGAHSFIGVVVASAVSYPHIKTLVG